MTQNTSKCQDSGQMILSPVTRNCIRPGDTNEIAHYANH